MKFITLVLAISLIFIGRISLFSQQHNLLSGKYSLEQVRDNLETAEDYKPLPPCGDPAWDIIPENDRQGILQKAESYLGFDYPLLKATTYLDFVRNGNRTRYQDIYSERRDAIVYLLMGEILENKGRFMDDLLNGVWTICEESSWTIPAHIGGQKIGSGLPDKDEPVVALFSAETGSLMAAVDYFVGDKLDSINPIIRKRLRNEVRDRILDPLLNRNDFWWMGLTGRIPNNWNPWIVSNWINTVLVLEKDPQRRAAGIYKSLVVLDQFLNPYPADGGCDEGPGYWGRAGASLFDCLNQLKEATNGKIDIFREPLVKNIGDYIWKVHISASWFVNFADASARNHPDPALMFRFGKATGSANLMGFAKTMVEMRPTSRRRSGVDYNGLMVRTLPDYFIMPELQESEMKFSPGGENFLPDLQVFTAREVPGSIDGFYLAAKGGNNNESHNHNDVGNFIAYLNGEPLLIDVGVGTYTAKTFSSARYEIWTMQSAYHNLPDINGAMEKNGAEFKAADVMFTGTKSNPGFSLDIAGAYPVEAGVQNAVRKIELDRKRQQIILTDKMSFTKIQNKVTFHFITRYQPITKDNRLIFNDTETGKEIAELTFPGSLKASIEPLELEDRQLENVWGDKLYRINLAGAIDKKEGSWQFRIIRK